MVTSASNILASMAKYYWILRSCFEFLQKVFLDLMYPFSCVLWAINSKQLLSHLSLLLSQLKHSFICKGVQGKCKGVIGQNADIHFLF